MISFDSANRKNGKKSGFRKSSFGKKGGLSKKRKNAKKSKIKVINYHKIIDTSRRLKPQFLCLPLFVAVVGISLFGVLMVYSASNYNAMYYFGNPYHYFTKQLIGFVLGLIALGTTYMLSYQVYRRYYKIFLVLGVILLCLVFVPGIGISKLGAKRWIGIGGFSMQPSEVAKFCFVIFASGVFARNNTQDAPTWKRIIAVLCAGGILCALILQEPNLSITLCLGITMFCMLFLCGTRMRRLVLIVAPALILVPALIVAEPYRIKRLVAFVDPWATPKAEGFQLIQSLYSLGNGGLFGVGFLNSTQKYMFLPFSESDFIFSIIGEEFGLVGAILFISVLFYIIYKIFCVGAECKDFFGKYLCYGIASVIFVQSAINLAVVTGSIPPTGLPLPFISFGGTSLAVFLGAIGIVLNVAKQNAINKRSVET